MKIAYITVSFPSVTETFVLREINYLNESRFADKIKVFAYKKPKINWINKDNLDWLKNSTYVRKRYLYNVLSMFLFCYTDIKSVKDIFMLWIKDITRLNIISLCRTFIHILSGFGVARDIKKQNIDHLHAHFSTASTIALTAHILTNIQFSITAHASGDIYFYTPLLFEKLKRAKRIISISDYNKKYLELITNYQINSKKIEIIHNGVEIPPPRIENNTYNEPVLFISATFTGFKGYGTLMSALSIVKKREIPFKLYAAGDGPFYNTMKKKALELRIDKQVYFLGIKPLTVVREFMKSADIFVFPSEIYINGQRDGMPTAITEAMSYGLPIVSTYVSGIPEQVENGRNGFLVPERDETALADRISMLLVDSELRIKMGEYSYKIAKEKFDINKTMFRLSQVFNEIIVTV